MKAQAVLTELESLAKTAGANVSYEALRSSYGIGGLCRVKGQYRIIIEKRAGTNERIAAMATALAELDLGELDSGELKASKPVLDLLALYRTRSRANVRHAS